MSKRVYLVALFSCLLGLAVFSFKLSIREFYAAKIVVPQANNLTFFWINFDGPVTSGARHQQRILYSCLNLFSDPSFSLQGPAASDFLVEKCLKQAHHAEATGVHIAEAPAVLAAERQLAGDVGGTLTLLENSRRRAPHDYNLALQRINIAFRLNSLAEISRVGGFLQAELPLLIASGRGVGDAASLYIRVPQMRPLIDAIAEDLDPVDRQRFIQRVRRDSRG